LGEIEITGMGSLVNRSRYTMSSGDRLLQLQCLCGGSDDWKQIPPASSDCDTRGSQNWYRFITILPTNRTSPVVYHRIPSHHMWANLFYSEPLAQKECNLFWSTGVEGTKWKITQIPLKHRDKFHISVSRCIYV